MITLLKWCRECDEETPHRLGADGPLDCDLYSFCLYCYGKMRATSDEDYVDGPENSCGAWDASED